MRVESSRRIRLARIAVVLVLLLTAACGKKKTSGEQQAPAGGPWPGAAEAAAAAGDAGPAVAKTMLLLGTPVVRLVDPGAEPRREQRYHVSAGDRRVATIVGDQSLDLGLGSGPIQAPTMNVDLELTTREAGADGVLLCDYALGNPRLTRAPGATAEPDPAMAELVAKIAGYRGTLRLDARGVPVAADLETPAKIPFVLRSVLEQLAWSAIQLAVPFPTEPIGAGARWEVDIVYPHSSLTVAQTATFHLTDLQENGGTVEWTIRQSVAPQPITEPGATPVAVSLTKFDGQGSGSWTFDLARLVPVSQDVSLHLVVGVATNVGGAAAQNESPSDLHIRVTSP